MTDLAPPPDEADDGVRHRYVIGIFSFPASAQRAITDMSIGFCEAIVLSEATLRSDLAAATDAGGHAERVASRLAALLGASRKFAPLASVAIPRPADSNPASAARRLFGSLVQHLAQGAAVIVVHAPKPEQQLRISRAMLDAKCDILLTHDVLPVAARPSPENDACCENCATRACGRMSSSKDGATATPPMEA